MCIRNKNLHCWVKLGHYEVHNTPHEKQSLISHAIVRAVSQFKEWVSVIVSFCTRKMIAGFGPPWMTKIVTMPPAHIPRLSAPRIQSTGLRSHWKGPRISRDTQLFCSSQLEHDHPEIGAVINYGQVIASVTINRAQMWTIYLTKHQWDWLSVLFILVHKMLFSRLDLISWYVWVWCWLAINSYSVCKLHWFPSRRTSMSNQAEDWERSREARPGPMTLSCFYCISVSWSSVRLLSYDSSLPLIPLSLFVMQKTTERWYVWLGNSCNSVNCGSWGNQRFVFIIPQG